MKLVKEEIFGPVVCAQPFSDESLEKIADEANNTSFGLAASVWTKDISTAHKLAAKIRAGTVWVNCHNIFDASLPFGGYKESGWGREMNMKFSKIILKLKLLQSIYNYLKKARYNLFLKIWLVQTSPILLNVIFL